MTTEQKFVISLYPNAHSVKINGAWHIYDIDGTVLSIGWNFGRLNRKSKNLAWQDAAESLNYEILRKLER